MIVNPSPFFPDHSAETWTFVGYAMPPNTPLCLRIICKCQQHLDGPCVAQMPDQLAASTFRAVELLLKGVLANKVGGRTVECRFWLGKCQHCGLFYWTCDKWDWVPWLSDLQTVHMLLGAVPIRNVCVDYQTGIVRIAIQKETILHFLRGKLTGAG